MTYELLNPTYLIARQAEIAQTGTTALEQRLAAVEYSTLQYQEWEARAIRTELKRRRASQPWAVSERDEQKAKAAGQRAAAAYKAGSSLG